MASKEEILDSIAKMSVMDLVDLVKLMEEKFGVSAAAAAVAEAMFDPEAKSQQNAPDAETASPDMKSDETPVKRAKAKAKKKTDEEA